MMKKIRDGFPDQRLVIVSRELLERQQELAICRHLHVTDIGHFPRTANHFVSRHKGGIQYIMIFCASGKGVVQIKGRKKEMTRGQAILIPPGVPHHYEADSSAPWNIYWFHFSGDQAHEYARLLNTHESQIIQIADTDAFIRRFETLYSSVVSAFSDSALVQASVELAMTLSHMNTLRTERYSKSRQSEKRILASIGYITSRYDQPHTLGELARMAGLSVPHYTALFRKQTGISPLRYLTRVRLRHACELLDLTDMHVSEVAHAVGYDDAFYFSRLFRKYNGRSPRNYRKLTAKSHRPVRAAPAL